MKTGAHPMRVPLKLFFKWGIQFDEKNPYVVSENGNRKVCYADKNELREGIMKKYHPDEYAQLQQAMVAAGASDPKPDAGPASTETPKDEPPKQMKKPNTTPPSKSKPATPPIVEAPKRKENSSDKE